MVGSLGQFGIMTELTFKVFPLPSAQTTIQVLCQSHEKAVDSIATAARSRWELDAVNYQPGTKTIYLRIAGPDRSNQLIAKEILDHWKGDASVVSPDHSDRYWSSVRELSFAGAEAIIVKVPTTTSNFFSLILPFSDDPEVETQVCCAGSLTFLAIRSTESVTAVDRILRKMSLTGMVLRGPVDTTWLGEYRPRAIDYAVKQAMDPANKFPDAHNKLIG